MVLSPRLTKGFTVIEMIVVVAVVGALLAAAAPLSRTFVTQVDVLDAGATYASMVRRAQTLAVSGRQDSAWGVYASSSALVLYKGTGYAARDAVYDERYTFTTPLQVSGVSDVSFAKMSGLPSTTGTTTITAQGATAAEQISINAKGTVSY